LILRVFYLEDFVSSPISSSYLTNIQSDFAKVRNAGIKCIVRFAYSDDNDNGAPQDATKAQILAHIAQLAPILQANADIIPVMQAGFIGAWGEWYYTDNFGINPTQADYANRKDVVNALLAALPAGKMVQIRTPALKQKTYSATSALSLTQAFTNTSVARIGHHNDCFLASEDDYGTYNNIATEYPYLEQETKYVPMGGETCALNAPRSECSSAVSEMAKFHWSYLNLDYHPGVISEFEADNCFSTIENRLGYRFEMVSASFPQTANVNLPITFTLKIKNLGFATPYNSRTAYLVLRNTVTDAEFSVPLNTNPRFWNAGTSTNVNESVTLPSNIVAGTYKMYLHLPDSNPSIAHRPEYAIRMANDLTWDPVKGYNDLKHTINISSSLGVNDSVNGAGLDLTIYPVPSDGELVMEMEGIEDFKVTVYNSLGQNVGSKAKAVTSGKATIDTQSLSNGVYFVSFDNDTRKETRRIIVSHR
ncbi:MAG TPA: DUF4832 domain-containing protein, partial [Flavobacterium sp.]